MRRRVRRSFSVGIVFILYSVLRVYSSNAIISNTPRPDDDDLSTFLPKSTIPYDDLTVFGSTPETIQSTTSYRCKYSIFNYCFLFYLLIILKNYARMFTI